MEFELHSVYIGFKINFDLVSPAKRQSGKKTSFLKEPVGHVMDEIS